MKLKKCGCILLSEDKTKIALVYRRKHNDYSFPKGHLEENETLSECALRETEEETGRMCHLLINDFLGIYTYKNKSEGQIETFMYLAIDEGISNKIIKEEDKEELVWVDIAEVECKLTYQNLKDFWNNNKIKIEEILKGNQK